jgi:hypothetical protein
VLRSLTISRMEQNSERWTLARPAPIFSWRAWESATERVPHVSIGRYMCSYGFSPTPSNLSTSASLILTIPPTTLPKSMTSALFGKTPGVPPRQQNPRRTFPYSGQPGSPLADIPPSSNARESIPFLRFLTLSIHKGGGPPVPTDAHGTNVALARLPRCRGELHA